MEHMRSGEDGWVILRAVLCADLAWHVVASLGDERRCQVCLRRSRRPIVTPTPGTFCSVACYEHV